MAADRWTASVEPYREGGPFVRFYRAGLDLMGEVNDDWETVSARAKRLRTTATGLNIVATTFAAAAAFTAFPSNVSRVVAGFSASVAAVSSGSQFKPASDAAAAARKAHDLRAYRDKIASYLRFVNDPPESVDVNELEVRLQALQSERPDPTPSGGPD